MFNYLIYRDLIRILNHNQEDEAMKVFIFFCTTLLFSTGALLAATTMSEPWPVFAVAFGVWILFFRWLTGHGREEARRKARERMLDDFLRSQARGIWHHR